MPRDPAQARSLENWLDQLTKSFAERIVPVDRPVADAWGRMNAVRPLPIIDALLAATAKVNGMTLVTRDSSDVAGLGVPVLNPFEEPK